MAAYTQNLFKNKFKQPMVSLGQLTIFFQHLQSQLEEPSQFLLKTNLNHLKTFRNHLGLHTLNSTPSQGHNTSPSSVEPFF